MKTFITGGGGFIGRHIAAYFLKKGHDVIIYDNLSKTTKNNIQFLIEKKAVLIEGDVTNLQSLRKSITDDIDVIIHLAAKTGVIDSIKNPEKTHFVNVTGTLRLLIVAREKNIVNFVLASSGAVYGDSKILPNSEKLITIPISPYGASKLAAEHYLQAFCNSFDLNGISLRFSNVYGEGQSIEYAGVITKFKQNIRDGKPLVIFGDGSNTRDFVSVHDVVIGIRNAIENLKRKKGNFYNIATGKQTSIQELAKLILDISGKPLKIIHEKPRKGEIRHSYASIELAKKELRYSPKIDLKQGIKELLQTS